MKEKNILHHENVEFKKTKDGKELYKQKKMFKYDGYIVERYLMHGEFCYMPDSLKYSLYARSKNNPNIMFATNFFCDSYALKVLWFPKGVHESDAEILYHEYYNDTKEILKMIRKFEIKYKDFDIMK